MDLPSHLSYEEVQQLAGCRKTWKKLSACIGNSPAMTTCADRELRRLQDQETPTRKNERQVKITFFPTPNKPVTVTSSSTSPPSNSTINPLKRLKWTEPKSKAKKPPPWTNEQRCAWARAYYDKHFGPRSPSTSTSTSASMTSNLLQPKTKPVLWAAQAAPSTPTTPNLNPNLKSDLIWSSGESTLSPGECIHLLHLQRRNLYIGPRPS